MTNLVAEIVVTLTLVTNWTGVNFEGKELGYVATNHTATLTYEGKPHEFELKTVPSNIAVWRPLEPCLFITYPTNIFIQTKWYNPALGGTNLLPGTLELNH